MHQFSLKKRILFSLLGGILLGVILSLLFPVGKLWISLLSASIISTLCIFILWVPVKFLETGKHGFLLTFAAFTIRLVIGVGLMVALPHWGYDTEQQQAGYSFKDAYNRDTAAWELAASDGSLFSVFNDEFFTDQYGGLSFISALIYRIFSRDAHRPYLLLLLSSLAFALGVNFFYCAVRKRWNVKMALLASWIVTLYPEGVFFTSSQMREPFIIGGTMVLLWGMLNWFGNEKRKQILIICIPTVLAMIAISWLMSGAVLLLLSVWFGIEWIKNTLPPEKHKLAFGIMLSMIVVILGCVAFLGREWLRLTIWWDMREMLLTSGFVEMIVSDVPEPLQYAFITGYGILQIVPPAAVIESSAAIWKVISIFRSVGWYTFLPILIFGLYAVWKKENRKDRWVFLWLLLFTWAWIVFSSLRGGGDSWDNPRYRMIALPVMALLVVQLYHLRDHWLWRLVAIMGFSLALFTEWYISRYWRWFKRLSVPEMIGLIGIFTVLSMLSGVWVERRRLKKKNSGRITH